MRTNTSQQAGPDPAGHVPGPYTPGSVLDNDLVVSHACLRGYSESWNTSKEVKTLKICLTTQNLVQRRMFELPKYLRVHF